MLHIRVPATTANLGPGFDCLGLALELYNDFKIIPFEKGPSVIVGRGACAGLQGAENIFFAALRRVCKMAGAKPMPLRVEVDGRVPMARGLGSSATAIVAGAMAANRLLGDPLRPAELLLAMTREEGHPDNVAPAFFGGLTAAVDFGDRVLVKGEDLHPDWRLAVLIPDYPLSTEKARKAIPPKIPVRDAVFNLTRLPFIMDCLAEGWTEDLGPLLEDRIHEPYRKKLIKGYDAIRMAAREAGAAAVYLSGAGPTMAAFCLGARAAKRVSAAMLGVAKAKGFAAEAPVLRPSRKGATIRV